MDKSDRIFLFIYYWKLYSLNIKCFYVISNGLIKDKSIRIIICKR